VRTLFLALLVANVVLFGWALVTPAAPPMHDSPAPDVPRLTLASEAAAALATGDAAGASGALAAACRSIGPFGSEQEALRAAAAFREGGYQSDTRTEEARSGEGFWVSLAPQRDAAGETRVLARLARAGITDARVMVDTESRRISAGLFNDRGRADRRAAELQRLGYAPDVTERLHIGTTWWVDLHLRTAAELAEAESFNQDSSGQLALKPCPAALPAEPAALAGPAEAGAVESG